MKLSILFLALFLLIDCLPCQADTWKHFSDYTNIQPTKKSDPSICRVHFNAKQKINDRKDDPVYKINAWKLVMRRGMFKAEV